MLIVASRAALRIGMLLLPGLPAFAQVDTATITGTIVDPSGAAVVGARIVATSQTTGLLGPTRGIASMIVFLWIKHCVVPFVLDFERLCAFKGG